MRNPTPFNDMGATQIERPEASTSRRVEELAPRSMVDHFRVVRLLGSGGMGRVYLARDMQLGRRVALKLLRSRNVGIQRFTQEARNTARFNHPNIVTVYAYGEYHKIPYLALEYVQGETLRQRLRAHPPGLQEALRISRAIAAALAEAHRHEVLHLDLKPGNILIATDGQPKVVDFGLSETLEYERTKSLEKKPNKTTLETTAESVLEGITGTPVYMAPEQWRRESRSTATDIWALGTIIYQMVTSERPFKFAEKDPLTLALEITSENVAPSLKEAPEPLQKIIADCLAKRPEDRPPAADVCEVLESLLARPRPRLAAEESPFRGLLPFTSGEASLFYGRDREIAELVERLRQEPVVAVVGASGAGKSSLVQAGVIPRLTEQGRWTVIQVRPGPEPFKTLASRIIGRDSTQATETRSGIASGSFRKVDPGLSGAMTAQLESVPEKLALILEQAAEIDDTHILLVVDQLEELYTLGHDQETQTKFMRAIALAADDAEDPVRIVFTIRDDFLSRLANAGSEVRNVLRRVMLLQVPEQAALTETLIKPAESAGYRFEDPELVHEMVTAVGNKPSSLPLLQFTARMLWERRDQKDRILTRSAYEDLGGVAGALARHADGVLDSFTETEAPIARHILLQLVTAEDTRRVALRTDVLEGLGDDAEPVLIRLIDARLVSVVRLRTDTGSLPALELAHESLINSWERLRGWLDGNREELRFLAEAGQAADLWIRRGRIETEVWTGAALGDALRMLERCSGPIPEKVTDFVETGRRMEEARRARKRNLIAASFAVLLCILAIVAYQSQEATRQRNLAQKQKAVAEKQRAAAQRESAASAFVKGDLLAARTKLRTSMETDDSLLTRALWWQLDKHPLQWQLQLTSVPIHAYFSSDSQSVVVVTAGKSLTTLDVNTRNNRTILNSETMLVNFSDISKDGKVVIIGENDNRLGAWDRETRKLLYSLSGHRFRLTGAQFTSDGRTLISSDRSGHIRAWNLETESKKKEHVVIQDEGDWVLRIETRPGRRQFAALNDSGKITLWDIDKQKVIKDFSYGDGNVHDIAFSSNGQFLAVTGEKGPIKVWSVDDARSQIVIPPTGKVGYPSLAFLPNNRALAAGGNDGHVFVFDLETGRIITEYPGQTGKIESMRTSPDGHWLIAASRDNTLRLWDLKTPAKPFRIPPHTQGVLAVHLTADNRHIITGGSDKDLRVWDSATGRLLQQGKGHEVIYALDVHPGDGRIAYGYHDLNVASSSQVDAVARLQGSSTQTKIYGLEFFRDNTIIHGAGRELRIYDLEKERITKALDINRLVMDITVSADKERVAAATSDGKIHVWSTKSWAKIAELEGSEHTATWGVKFDPTGQYLASSSSDGYLRWWNVEDKTCNLIGRITDRMLWLDLSPDGTLAGVPCLDGISRVWNVLEGRLVHTLKGHRGEVNRLRFSSDGKLMVTVSDDTTVRVYDRYSGLPVWWAAGVFESRRTLVNQEGWLDFETKQPKPRPDGKWANAAHSAKRALEISDSPNVCVLTHDDRLQIWDSSKDELLKQASLKNVLGMETTSKTCIVHTTKNVWSYLATKEPPIRLTDKGVTAIRTSREEVIVAKQDGSISTFDAIGKPRESVFTNMKVELIGGKGAQLSAINRTENQLILGRINGEIAAMTLVESNLASTLVYDGTPISPVTHLLLGPNNILIAGFENGLIGIWNMATGKQLHSMRLHGPISYLVQTDTSAHAVTELGDHVSWDLSAFDKPYCEVLMNVWEKVPVIWQDGRIIPKSRPASHACLK